MTHSLTVAAGVAWSALHVVGLVALLVLYVRRRRRYLLLLALSWAVMSLWGITLPGADAAMAVLNGVVIPPLASVLGLWAVASLARATR